MPNIDKRIHFYYDGHTYEIEPASLNHDDAWFNSTSLLDGVQENGEVLLQVYDSDVVALDGISWEKWTLTNGTDGGELLYFEPLAHESKTESGPTTVENADGSTVETYTSSTTFLDNSVQEVSIVTTTSDGSTVKVSQSTTTFEDGLVIEKTITSVTVDEVTDTTTEMTATFADGSTIDYPTSSDNLFKFTGEVVDSILSNIDSYLANISSEKENAEIFKHAKTILSLAPKAADGGDAAYVWLGGAKSSDEDWYWVTSTISTNRSSYYLPVDYVSWGSVEPDNSGGIQGGLAMGLQKWPQKTGGIGEAGQWNDVSQEDLLYSVIEWNGLIGTSGKDTLKSGNDSCVVHAGGESDNIKTLGGDDVIYGQDGDDKISSGSGNDLIVGGSGLDVIDAGAGDDVIIFGDSADGATKSERIKGGDGNDIFVLTSKDKAQPDTILDFNGNGSADGDLLVLDSEVFDVFKKDEDVDEGEIDYNQVLGNQFLRGPGYSAPSTNETGIDDYLIFDTRSGKLYYDEDGNESGSAPILIAILKGKISTFDVYDIAIV